MLSNISFFEAIIWAAVFGLILYFMLGSPKRNVDSLPTIEETLKGNRNSNLGYHESVSSNLYLNNSLEAKVSFIERFEFPEGIKRKLSLLYPNLTDTQYNVGISGLRQFFICHLNANNRYIAMPSHFVDQIWHEFILDTYIYQKFCNSAFGKYLHHIPDSGDTGQTKKELGLLLIWELAQHDSNKRKVSNALFEADSLLNFNGSINQDSIGILKRKHSRFFSSADNISNSNGVDLIALSLLLQSGDLILNSTEESTKKETTSSGCDSSFMGSNGNSDHGYHENGASNDSSGSGSGSSCGGGCGGD